LPLGYPLEGGFIEYERPYSHDQRRDLTTATGEALLTDTFSLAPAKRKPGRPATASGSGKATSFNPADFDAKARKRRGMSAAGRARIAAAQKARWARFKKDAK